MSAAAASRGVRALAVLGRCVRAPFRVLLRARDIYVRQMTTCAAGRGPVGMVSVPRSRSHAFYRSAGDDDADVRELVRAASRARCSSVVARSHSMDIGRIDEDQPCEFGTGGGAMGQALCRRSRSCAVGSIGMSMGRNRVGAVAASWPLNADGEYGDNHGSRDSSVTVHGPPDIFEGSEKTSLDKLPEDILSYIHSLVPLRDAARAACVSHRFRSSWRCFPNLTFNLETLGLNKHQHREDEGRAKNVVESALGLNKHQHREDEGRAKNVVDRVNHILQNHSGVGVRTLELNLRACRDVITADYVESWLKLAVKPGIMELGVYLPSDLAYNFSCSLFSDEATSSLESLFLLCCDFHPTSGTGCWRSLTSVCLSSVRITEEELGCFLASTFALEKLSLSGCNEMVILKIPSLLQHLSFLEVSHCRMVQIIESDAPKLSTFSYVGPPIKISFGDSSVVKNMYVSSSSDSGIVQFARTRLPSIASNLQTLTLSTYREAFSTPMVPDKFPHLKNLDIYLTGRDNFRGYDFFSLVSFLEASPALEYFNLFAGEHGNLRRDSILGDSSREMRRVPGFHHDSLKRLCITGFCSAKSMVELICQVLENTPSLQVLVLDTTLGFDSVFVPPGKCHIMGKEALDEANRAVEAFRMHVEGKVPSSVGFMVWEPCKRCNTPKFIRT